jgi:OOP family OmpA-OmpF porin
MPSTTPLLVIGALAASVGLSGCAARESPALAEARSVYLEAAGDPQVSEHAPVALHEANQALQRAERMQEEEGDEAEAEHQAYVVRQRVQLARARAQEQMARTEVEQVGARRTETLLEARERELEELRARPTERGLVVTLGDVLFEFDRAELKPGSMRQLEQLASLLRQHPERRVAIEGHTDSIGDTDYNVRLSERRAEAVRGFLVRQGVDPARIVTRGYGQAFPVASNETEAGRQQNRRVEVVLARQGERAARPRQ